LINPWRRHEETAPIERKSSRVASRPIRFSMTHRAPTYKQTPDVNWILGKNGQNHEKNDDFKSGNRHRCGIRFR
jgi:hypothetical protein